VRNETKSRVRNIHESVTSPLVSVTTTYGSSITFRVKGWPANVFFASDVNLLAGLLFVVFPLQHPTTAVGHIPPIIFLSSSSEERNETAGKED
jgi:hypothetical protein